MANEMVVVEKVTSGHLKSSSKVISKYKGDLTKHFDQVCACIIGKVFYLARGSLTMDIEMMALARGIGRLTKVIDLTVKCDQVCVYLSISEYIYMGQWVLKCQ